MIQFVEEETVDDKLDTILDKLNYMDFNGKVIMSEPYRMSGDEKSVRLELTREGEDFKLPPTKPKEPEPIRKLTELDWLNIMNHYKRDLFFLCNCIKFIDETSLSLKKNITIPFIKKIIGYR